MGTAKVHSIFHALREADINYIYIHGLKTAIKGWECNLTKPWKHLGNPARIILLRTGFTNFLKKIRHSFVCEQYGLTTAKHVVRFN